MFVQNVYDDLKNDGVDLKYVRLPIVDEKAPAEHDFDLLVSALVKEPAETACVFNCQMGKGEPIKKIHYCVYFVIHLCLIYDNVIKRSNYSGYDYSMYRETCSVQYWF